MFRGRVYPWGWMVTKLGALILALLIAGFAVAQAMGGAERSVVGRFLAVSYNNVGKVIDVEVWVRIPGNDMFIVSPPHGVGEDTRLSARVGLFYAALLNHVDPRVVDAGFTVVDREEVSGASAGLAFTALYYSLIRGVYVNTRSVTFTGLIQPNGMVAAVGGIPAKLSAAAAAGLRVVYAPLEAVNASRPAALQVVPVCSFAQVVEGLYGVSYPPASPLNSTVFAQAALQMKKLLVYTMGLASGRVREMAASALNETSRLIREGRFYAAASVAYTAIVGLLDALNETALSNFTSHVLMMVNRTGLAEELMRYKLVFRQSSSFPLWRLEALLASDYRFYAASKLLSREKPYLRALGALRLLTSQQWLEVASRLQGPVIDTSVLKRGLELMVTYADLSARYLESLVAGSQVRIENTERLRLRELVNDMRMSYLKGDLLRAAAIAEDILMLVDRVMTHYDLGMGADPARVLHCAELQAGLNQAVAGYSSLVAGLLLEYATSINSTFVSAVLASEAASASILPLALSTVEQGAGVVEVTGSSSVAVLLAVAVAASILGAAGVVAFTALSHEVKEG